VELDSHADTCVFGDGCLVVYDTGITVSVEPYMATLGLSPEVPIVTAAVAYDHPDTGQTYVLFFHQSLYEPDVKTHLMNPFQVRHNNIQVHETPLQHLPDDQQHPHSHSIYHPPTDLHIPLQLQGTMSGFLSRKPTWDEVNDIDNHDVVHVHMTSPIEWEPRATDHADLEAAVKANYDRGYSLVQKGSRDINSLHLRGRTEQPSTIAPAPKVAKLSHAASATVTTADSTMDDASTGSDSTPTTSNTTPVDAHLEGTTERSIIGSTLTLARQLSAVRTSEVDRYVSALMPESPPPTSALSPTAADKCTSSRGSGLIQKK